MSKGVLLMLLLSYQSDAVAHVNAVNRANAQVLQESDHAALHPLVTRSLFQVPAIIKTNRSISGLAVLKRLGRKQSHT